jgi:Mg/Co/Ni transporter MgtE
MIINGGNCANVASTTLVRKLNLNIIKQEKLYRL